MGFLTAPIDWHQVNLVFYLNRDSTIMEKKEKLCEQSNEQNLSQPMVVSIKSKDFGCGTGFFVKENLIATNIHCVAGATSVSAKLLESNIEYVVEGVAAYDALNDLVILKIEGESKPFPIGNSDSVEKGELVKAIGCPTWKVYVTTDGVFHSTLNKGQWLQTTTKIGDGYSGGPLLNSEGQVIGINFGSGNYYSAAISSNILKDLLSQVHTIEPLAQWQKRQQISAYDYLVKSKRKIQTENYDNAIANLDKTIQLNPDYIIAYINRGDAKKSLAESKFGEGDLVEAQKLHQGAIDDFTEAIRLCPDFVGGLNGRGIATSRLGQFKTKVDDLTEAQQFLLDAVDDFTEAIRLCPDYAPAYNSRADAKLHLAKIEVAMGNMKTPQDLYQGAMTDINIAIEKQVNISIEDPNVAVCYHTRGEIKEAMDDLHGAKTDFEKAIKNTKYAQSSKVSDDLKRVKEALRQQE